jgi:hypothetical protein
MLSDLGLPHPGRVLRVHHVARMCGVQPRTVRGWAQSGRLAARKHGPRIWFFLASDVMAFLHGPNIGNNGAHGASPRF